MLLLFPAEARESWPRFQTPTRASSLSWSWTKVPWKRQSKSVPGLLNGGDGLPGELANDWVLNGGGEMVTAETRVTYHRSMQKACFLQARNFGGIVLGVKDNTDTESRGKLLGYAVLHPPGTPLKPGSTDEICMFTHLMCCKGVGEPPVSASKIGDVGAKRFKQFEKTMARQELAELRKDYQGKYWKLGTSGR